MASPRIPRCSTHRMIPSARVDARVWHLPDQSTVPNEPLLPRHFKLHELFKHPDSRADVQATDVVTGRRLVLGNDDVRISYVVAGGPSPLYRNAVGDECVYIESGPADARHVSRGPWRRPVGSRRRSPEAANRPPQRRLGPHQSSRSIASCSTWVRVMSPCWAAMK